MTKYDYDNFKARLFTGIIYNNLIDLEKVLVDIKTTFSLDIDEISPSFSFDHSSYYLNEMGTKLKRVFISFSPLVLPLKGPEYKVLSQQLEKKYAIDDKRNINIDPGLLTLHNLLLYSTKNYSHRVPCIQGIYADLTYIFTSKNISFLPWTYPDFKQEAIKDFFLNLRKKLKTQLLQDS